MDKSDRFIHPMHENGERGRVLGRVEDLKVQTLMRRTTFKPVWRSIAYIVGFSALCVCSVVWVLGFFLVSRYLIC